MDDAHINEEAELIIKYIHATENHEYIVNKTLAKDQGLTHTVFEELPEEEIEGLPEEDKEESEWTPEEKEAMEKKNKQEALKLIPRNIVVDEVVREPKMHFFSVPKLGSYMAVELKYQSCLNEEAFDKGYREFIECRTKRLDLALEKEEWEKELEELKKQKEEDGDEYTEELKEWPEIKEPPYETIDRRYVVCLDTMGQDRKLSEDEKYFVLDIIDLYSKTWTNLEMKNLESDIIRRDKMHLNEKDLIDTEDAPTNRFEDEENLWINDQFAEMDPEDQPDEDARLELIPPLKRQWITTKVTSDEFKKAIFDFKQFKVIKYSRFFLSLFYFLGYEREHICEEGTNKLWWKKAKELVNNDLYEKIKAYTPIGPKENEYKKYLLINFIEKNCEGITLEDMEQFSWYLSKLFKWMLTMIELRKEDILKRREIKLHMREIRELREQEFKEREEIKALRLLEAKDEFEANLEKELAEKAAAKELEKEGEGEEDEKPEGEDKEQEEEEEVIPKFDEEAFDVLFDEENAPVIIPPEVVDDIDNDWEVVVLEEE